MRIVCSALLVLALTACGFHLRGSDQLPVHLQALQLQLATPNDTLARSLKRSLHSAGVQIQSEAADNIPELRIGAVRHQRRVLSVDTAGNPQEYELTASTTVEIPEMTNGYQLPSRELSVRRDYLYESTGVLSASDQETRLKTEMERELARRILRTLRAAPAGKP